jgi:hypothetical protein
MSSLRQFAESPRNIIDTAIQMWKSCFQATVVVEGRNDVRFFTNLFNPKVVRIVAADGKRGVLQSFLKSKSSNIDVAKFVVDIDTDLCTGKAIERDASLLYIAEEQSVEQSHFANDLECLLIRSGVLNKLCNEYSSPLSPVDLLKRIMTAGSVVGALRNSIYRNVSPREWADTALSPIEFVVVRTLDLRDERVAEFVEDSGFAEKKKILEDYEIGKESALRNPWLYCRGHDLTEILAAHFCASSTYRIVREEVERSLRLAAEWHHLEDTPIGKALREWKTPPLAAIPRRPFLKAEYRTH